MRCTFMSSLLAMGEYGMSKDSPHASKHASKEPTNVDDVPRHTALHHFCQFSHESPGVGVGVGVGAAALTALPCTCNK